MSYLAEQPLESTLSAVVIRADGSREDLGVIAQVHVKRGWFARLLAR